MGGVTLDYSSIPSTAARPRQAGAGRERPKASAGKGGVTRPGASKQCTPWLGRSRASTHEEDVCGPCARGSSDAGVRLVSTGCSLHLRRWRPRRSAGWPVAQGARKPSGRQARGCLCTTTLRRARLRVRPGATMCVQDADAQCILQFTLHNAAGCALHRRASRVIHRSELSS